MPAYKFLYCFLFLASSVSFDRLREMAKSAVKLHVVDADCHWPVHFTGSKVFGQVFAID